MRLVADDQIKVPDREQLAFRILNGVDAVHHRLVGREDAVRRGIVPLFAEIRNRKFRQQVHEAAFRLRDQRVSIRQKQDILHPAVFQQHLAQRNHRARFARTCRHYQQCFAAVARIKSVANSLDCVLLIVPSGDVLVHHNIVQMRAHPQQVEQLLQIAL